MKISLILSSLRMRSHFQTQMALLSGERYCQLCPYITFSHLHVALTLILVQDIFLYYAEQDVIEKGRMLTG